MQGGCDLHRKCHTGNPNVRKVGPNQLLVLCALAELEKAHGRDAFRVGQVLDQIWDDHFNLSRNAGDEPDRRVHLLERAAHGEKDAVKALKITADSQLRVAVRARATKRRHTARPWARALERLNPPRCFRLLAEAGLIERMRDGRLQMISLTDEGRGLVALVAPAKNATRDATDKGG